MEIYIVRHGETYWNEKKLLQGSEDIELNENGRQLARITGEALMDVHFDAIYSSPLKRAYETACLISNGRDIPITKCDQLRELCFGKWEGQNMSVLLRDQEQKFRYFFKQPHLYEPTEGGETLSHLCDRAAAFMTDFVEPLEDKYSRIMIVAHAAINKGIMTHVKKHSLEYFWTGGIQANCNVIMLDYSRGKYTILEEVKTFY
jgi:probable phosphoglycerate mutase